MTGQQPANDLTAPSSPLILADEPYLVDAADLAQYEPTVLRILAGLLWFASLGGTVLAVDHWDGTPSGILSVDFLFSLSVALLTQLSLTIVQIVTCHHWRSGWYLGAVMVSSWFSFLGYRQFLAIPLTAWITGIPGDPFMAPSGIAYLTLFSEQPSYMMVATVVHGLMLGMLTIIDVLPERIFIRR